MLPQDRLSTGAAEWYQDEGNFPTKINRGLSRQGSVCLFRQPKERPALSYELSGTLVWNPALMDENMTRRIADSLHGLIPCAGVAP